MLIKVHKSYREVVAVCDFELIGKTFEEGNFQLEIKNSFFNGERFSEEKAVKIIRELSREDATFNIVGEKSVKCALKAGVIFKDGIKKIQGVPFAMVLL